jgi:hypothetical protein
MSTHPFPLRRPRGFRESAHPRRPGALLLRRRPRVKRRNLRGAAAAISRETSKYGVGPPRPEILKFVLPRGEAPSRLCGFDAAAFGNFPGDRQMLEYTKAGDGARLLMIVLHDDEKREYAYGPANGLPDTKVGTFPQALYDEAKKDGWFVISMKQDWKRIFTFE